LVFLPRQLRHNPIADQQSATSTLVLRAKPKRDESDIGFLLRLTEINSYDTAYWIVKEARLPLATLHGYSFVSNPAVSLLPLAQLTGLNLKDLSELIYHPTSNEQGGPAFGHSVSKYMLKRHRPRVCPECLRQSNHCRKHWDFPAVTSCPLHDSMLLEECPACCQQISWARKGASLCRCGADWRETRTPLLPEHESCVSRLVYQKLGLMPTSHANSQSNPLYNWSLPYVLEALFLIASHREGHLDTRARHILAKKQIQKIHKDLLRAFLVFESWPINFYQFLDQVRCRNSSSRSKTGLYADFGSLYVKLYGPRSLSSRSAQVIRNEFEKYLSNHWDEGYLAKAIWLKPENAEGKYIGMVNAARVLKIHPQVLSRFVSKGKLSAVVKKNGRTRLFLVDATSVEKLRLERARYLSLERAARFLGICQFNLLRLVEHSLIVPTESPTADIKKIWKFDKDILGGFLTKLSSKTKSSRLRDHSELQPFSRVLGLMNKKLSSSGGGIQILIDDILRGKLVPRKRRADKAGITGLSFSRQEVKTYLKAKLGVKTNKNLQPAINFKAHGLTPQLMYFLVDKGLINTNQVVRRSKGGAIITRDSILLFESEFIFAKEAARSVGTSVGFLINALRTVDVTPVSGKKIDFGPQYIFRRADLDQINLAKLIERMPKQHINKRSNLISSAEAAAILSIPKETVAELVKNDVLKPSSSRDSEQHLFYRPHVERYQGQFENIHELVSTKAAADLLKITRPMLYHSWIRSGYLNCEVVGKGQKRFLRKSEIEKVSSFLKSVVSTKQAARLLGVPYTYVYRWRTKKLLKSVRNPYPRALRGFIYSKTELANLRVSHEPIGSQQKTLLKVEPSS
jgi:TniQ protein